MVIRQRCPGRTRGMLDQLKIDGAPTGALAVDEPPPGRKPIMRQRWEDVSFLHWPVDPARVSELIPPGLDVDTHGGRAWVGLVPFRMVGIGARKGPSIPYLGTFPETNVRTYVIGPDGPGVWFHSLEASRLLPVAVARLGYRLPYFFASMQYERIGDTHVYSTRRRWPGPRGVGGEMRVRPGRAITHHSPFERFLTARWRLYTRLRGRIYSAEIRHDPWPLQRVEAANYDMSLLGAVGYRVRGAPHVMYSPGVDVTAYTPRPVAPGN